LVGDSHGRHWIPAVREVAVQEEWRFVVMTRASCPFGDFELTRSGELDTGCIEWREAVMELLLEDPPDHVVVSSLRAYGYELFDWDLGSDVEQVAAYTRSLDELVAAGIEITVLGDVPYFPVDIPTCLAQASATECVFPRDEVATAHPDALADAARARDGVTLVDIESIVCGPEACGTVLGGLGAYRDRHHISASFSRSFAPILRDVLAG
jgi:hypothetical protein